MAEKYDVFLSGCPEDADELRRLASCLEGRGVSCISSDALKASARLIAAAIEGCSVFIAVISSSTKNSQRAALELDRAFKVGKTIIPFIIEDCDAGADYKFVLSRTQAIMAYKKKSEAYEKLTASVLKSLGISDEDMSYAIRSEGRRRTAIISAAAALAVIAAVAAVIIIAARPKAPAIVPSGDSAVPQADTQPAASVASGGLAVDYDSSSHILRLSGADIPDYNTYTLSDRPWDNVRDVISGIEISGGVDSVGSNAFRECYALDSVSLSPDIRYIGDYSFALCSELSEVTLPQKLEKIGEGAFSYCPKLTSITIPDSVTEIGKSAFYGCSALTEIHIPASVAKIGDAAFEKQYNKTVTIYTAEGSAADAFAKENGLSVSYITP